MSNLSPKTGMLNDPADITDRVVFLSGIGTQILTREAHANRHLVVSEAGIDDNIAYKLPSAKGTGDKYTFFVSALRTTTSLTFAIGLSGDTIVGGVIASATVAEATDNEFWFSTNATTVTLNATTQGGLGGDWLEFVDVSPTIWHMRGATHCSGDQVTPFS